MEVECPQVSEDVLGVEGVDFRGSDEVGEDELVVAGVGGFLAVVHVQRLNVGDAGVYQGKGEPEHGVCELRSRCRLGECQAITGSQARRGLGCQSNLQVGNQGV